MIFSDFYKNPKSPLSKLRPSQSQLRPQPPPAAQSPEWLREEYSDLLSKDKAKQKAAVQRYLAARVKNDWEFPWPPPLLVDEATGQVVVVDDAAVTAQQLENGNAADQTERLDHDEAREDEGYKQDSESDAEDGPQGDQAGDDQACDDAESVYSVVSEDPLRWKPRLDWASDLSDSDVDADEPVSPGCCGAPATPPAAKEESREARRSRRRRQVREEASWNPGLACFEARRNAWTGARVVRVRSRQAAQQQPQQSTSPRSPRRLFFRRSVSGSPPSPTGYAPQPPPSADGSSLTSDTSSLANHTDRELGRRHNTGNSKGSTSTAPTSPPLSIRTLPVETLLSTPHPLLPPSSSFRAAITPSIYLNLYDKIILHNMQPACPINLTDMLRACVAGWQRDGEWPPRPAEPLDAVLARKVKRLSAASTHNATRAARRMSFGLLGRERDLVDAPPPPPPPLLPSQPVPVPTGGKGIRKSLQRALGLGSSPEVEQPLNASAEKR